MKRLLSLITISFFLISSVHAQFEIKTNPVILIFGGFSGSVEYGIADNFGVEATGWVIQDIGGLGFLHAKYYFNPQDGLDRFSIGGFLTAGNLGLGAGFQIGQKIVSPIGLLFEFGLGAGRGFTDSEFIPYLKIQIGYRFNEKS